MLLVALTGNAGAKLCAAGLAGVIPRQQGAQHAGAAPYALCPILSLRLVLGIGQANNQSPLVHDHSTSLIVMGHHPVVGGARNVNGYRSANADNGAGTNVDDGWADMNGDGSWARLFQILRKHKVSLYTNGHDHGKQRDASRGGSEGVPTSGRAAWTVSWGRAAWTVMTTVVVGRDNGHEWSCSSMNTAMTAVVCKHDT
eukprot:363292-Chlamydomonas_euryale.AAC.4